LGNAQYVESIVALIIMLSALGIPVYGLREFLNYKENYEKGELFFNQIFSLQLYTTLVFSILLLFCYFFEFGISISQSQLIVALTMIFSGLFSYEWYFQAVERFKFIFWRTIIVRVVVVVLMFNLVKDANDGVEYLSTLAVFNVMIGLLNVIEIRKFNKSYFKLVNPNFSQHLRPLSMTLLIVSFVGIITSFGNLFLEINDKVVEISVFNLGLKLSKVPIAIISSISLAVFPSFNSLLIKDTKSEILKFLNRIIDSVVVLGVSSFFFLMLFSRELVIFFAGSDYIETSATSIIKILSILPLIIGFSNIFCFQILLGFSKYNTIVAILFLGLVFYIITAIIFSNYMGAVGSALAILLVELFVLFGSYYKSRLLIEGFSLNIKFLIITFCLFSPSMFISLIHFDDVFLQLFSRMLAFIVYSFVVLRYFLKNEFLGLLLNKISSR